MLNIRFWKFFYVMKVSKFVNNPKYKNAKCKTGVFVLLINHSIIQSVT